MAYVWRYFLGQNRVPAAAAVTLVAIILGLGRGPAGAAEELDLTRVTDRNVEDAIQKAVEWIKSQRNEQGHWEPGDNPAERHWGGSTGLAVLSLLYAGEDPREAFMSRSLDWLAAQTLNGTYAIGTRAHALALVPGGKYKSRLESDLKWLLDEVWPATSEHPGCYGYIARNRDRKNGYWDNSASQYGVLGVWMAAEAGLSVPDSYWDIVGQHWLDYQGSDGGWGYRGKEQPSGSMTAAGLASLFVVLDYRYASRLQEAAGILSAIEAGMSWFGREYTPDNPHGLAQYRYYYLYGVERVGRASGYKYFREKDWFREGAAYLLKNQQKEGNWRDTGAGMDRLRNSAFALMFLCHGRAPLLFNKLRHGADWNDRLRDVAGLNRYVSHTFERLLNWQIVHLAGPLEDLLEAPVLYMYGKSEWPFNDVEVQKLREYCQRGGLIFAVAGEDSAEFRRGFEKLARRAFPEYPLAPVASDHPLLNGEVWFAIEDAPLLLHVDNGVRTLMLLSTADLADSWNRYAVRGRREKDFQLAANVYQYATDKTRVRSRLETPYIPLHEVPIRRTIRVARIRYAGPWDLEPYGWSRLRNYMNNETGTNLLVTSGIALDSGALADFRVAYITGNKAFKLSEPERKGLRHFLTTGGTLLADGAGGARAFIKSLEQELRDVLHEEPRVVPPDSFLLTGAGLPDAVDLAGTQYRRAAHGAGSGRGYPRLRTFGSRRRFSVIYSPLDLTAGLVGTPIYNVAGYAPDSVLRIARNLLLYAELSSAGKARLHRGTRK